MPHDGKAIIEGGLEQADLDALRPTLARIARVAKTLFAAPLADVALFQNEGAWRASASKIQSDSADPASDLLREASQVVWVEDLTADDRFARHPAVTGVPHLRFYAGAPISLESGKRLGALAVYGLKTRARDEGLAERLRDMADLVAHECDRIFVQRERTALLEEVRRQEQRLERAVELANLHVFEMDFAEHSLVKAGVEEDFFDRPLSFGDLAGGQFLHVHPEDREKVVKTYLASAHSAEGVTAPMEWRANRTDGKEVWVQASAKLYRDDQGRPLRLVGSLQNVTERKQHEKQLAEAKAFAEAASVAKSVFLATMSHEIRTPLNGVLGMAQAMEADELSAVQRERLGVVRQSGQSLLAILNDLLDFSKIEAGKLELESIDFDLAEIAHGAYAAYTALATKKGLDFTLDIDQALGVYRGDPTRVRQILYNLISNALKFTDHGDIRVSGAFDDGRLILTVADTGIGMSEATVESLFSKFSQADASTTRKFGGTGLGLAICKELTGLMGGEVSVRSKLGRGSAFTVVLPLPRVGESAGVAAPEPAAEEDVQALDIRVLAAEDNSVNQLVLKTLLHQIGIEPVIVENGELAVEAWRKGDWDVVLMDVQMPVMDGPTAVRAIRMLERESGRLRTPIIALTANAMSHQVAEYLEAGMDGHLAKPIEADKLFATLAAVLDGDPEAEPAEARRA